MSKDPAVLFYTSDFLADTFMMNDEQVGKYIRLLCLQHLKSFLTENDMLKICETRDEDIWSKFTKKDDCYFNEAWQEIIEKRKKYSESRRKNRTKKEESQPDNIKHMKNISSSYEKHMGNGNGNENINENEIEKKGGAGENENSDFLDKVINEFVESHGDYEVLNPGKERAAAGKLLNLYKKHYPDADSKETLEGLRVFFDKCNKIKNDWMRNNMSLTLITTKFNEIKKELKNAGKSGNHISDDFKRALYKKMMMSQGPSDEFKEWVYDGLKYPEGHNKP